MTQPPQILNGIAPIAVRYAGVLLDLWGTVHDGYQPLPGALDAMTALKEQGARILIISNAPRRSRSVVEKMDEIGIPQKLYDAVLSSGEAVHRALAKRADPWHARLGQRVFLLAPEGDDSVLERLPLTRVDALAEADFIVAVGTYRREDRIEDYEDFLHEALTRSLPMVCANPDRVVLRGSKKELCAGAIAERYLEMGGDVYFHGKPHARIYELGLRLLAVDDPARILAIGDSLRTDVAGATAAGIDAVLVTGGIHAEKLGVRPFETPHPDRLATLYETEGSAPIAAVPAFRW